jgi:hypothetical protein
LPLFLQRETERAAYSRIIWAIALFTAPKILYCILTKGKYSWQTAVKILKSSYIQKSGTVRTVELLVQRSLQERLFTILARLGSGKVFHKTIISVMDEIAKWSILAQMILSFFSHNFEPQLV